MENQLIALGLVLIGAFALSIYGMRQQRKSKRARSSDGQDGVEAAARAERGAGVVPAFQTFTAEVGRVAEAGQAVHVALGSGGLLSEDGMVSIAALQGLAALTKLSAAYDTPPYLTTGDPTLYLLADTQLRDAYARLGTAQGYRPGCVRFSAPTPTLYAAQAATLTLDEPVGTHINLGAFDQEASLLVDAAVTKKAKLAGGAVSPAGLSALYPDLTERQLIIGEELFAGGAEVTDRSAFLASLAAANLLRWLVILGILVAAGISLVGPLLEGGG